MNSLLVLTEEQMEQVALEVRQYLMDNDMWDETNMYVNGKRYKEDKVQEGYLASEYFEYANDKTISISTEGRLYDMINYYAGYMEKLNEIVGKYGMYFEQGDAWNMACYYI